MDELKRSWHWSPELVPIDYLHAGSLVFLSILLLFIHGIFFPSIPVQFFIRRLVVFCFVFSFFFFFDCRFWADSIDESGQWEVLTEVQMSTQWVLHVM